MLATDPNHHTIDNNKQAPKTTTKTVKTEDPLHFCIPPSLNNIPPSNDNDTKQNVTRPKMMIANIHPGEMLYLPASWFHQVYSSGGEEGNEKKKTATATTENKNYVTSTTTNTLNGLHVALNYWFHPPDTLDNFNKPYQHDYWENHWKRMGMPEK